jgi:hypothetical protein
MRRLITIGLALIAGAAAARPPLKPDPALAPWYRSLLQPGTNYPCCSVADCRRADYRITGNRYEVRIDGKWLPVLPSKILTRTDNPTGHAIVCWDPAQGIMCFIRPPES